MEIIASLKNVNKRYGNCLAISNVNIEIGTGRIIGLVGENGAGKTTLLRLLSDIVKPDSGEMTIKGCSVGENTHRLVSYMPDSSNLYRWMNIRQIIVMYEDLYSDFSQKQAFILAEKMNLDCSMKISSLSKGYIERVMLMLAFSRDTFLYLLDEPLDGVDPIAKKAVMSIIREHNRDNSTIFISTHMLRDMEPLLDEVVFMANGAVQKQIVCDEVREQHGMSINEYFSEVMAS